MNVNVMLIMVECESHGFFFFFSSGFCMLTKCGYKEIITHSFLYTSQTWNAMNPLFINPH